MLYKIKLKNRERIIKLSIEQLKKLAKTNRLHFAGYRYYSKFYFSYYGNTTQLKRLSKKIFGVSNDYILITPIKTHDDKNIKRMLKYIKNRNKIIDYIYEGVE